MIDFNDSDNKYVTVIKNPMKNMYKKPINNELIKAIGDAIERTSKIDFHTYNYLSLYFMHLYESNVNFPYIDEAFMGNIMVTVTKRDDNRGTGGRKDSTKEQLEIFQKFYDKHYKPLLTDKDISLYDKLNQILQYEATDIVKNIENNIKQHYVQHVRKLVDAYYDIKRQIDVIKHDKTL